MLHLIPQPKELTLQEGFLREKAFAVTARPLDSRVAALASKLPRKEGGVALDIQVSGKEGEDYTLTVAPQAVTVTASGPAGAFYGLQTLGQLLRSPQVPCLVIRDKPDFPHRGFYHDVTRGKIPTLATLKALVDNLASFKINSLQLYVEHTFPFRECADLAEKTGCLTGEELEELDRYCQENFIDFVPSLSTFGHLYELLNQEKYWHLRLAQEIREPWNFWNARMRHHTIDPLHPESFPLVASLIDQYAPHFSSPHFNICCDETFDLKNCPDESRDAGKLYVDFVQKIVSHVQGKGKQVWMWADILLQHPETIGQLPQDVVFLNWNYSAQPKEENIRTLAQLGRPQILCPGTTTWSRLCENVAVEEENISRMARYAKEYGALGILNTNWGDWGNPCTLELAQYGLVLGAAKSWNEATQVGTAFDSHVNALVYGNDNAMDRLRQLSGLHSYVKWNHFAQCYFARRCQGKVDVSPVTREDVDLVQRLYRQLEGELAGTWGQDSYRQEMLVAAQGLCLLAQLYGKLAGWQVEQLVDSESWIGEYSRRWLASNRPSELANIQEMLRFCAQL